VNRNNGSSHRTFDPSRNRVRFQRSDSTYGSRSGSEESNVTDEAIRTSVEDPKEIEEVWNGCQRKYRNDPQKQRAMMDMLFGTGWMSVLKESIKAS
jgi:hypothetical protein